MVSESQKVVLVTGANRGLGLALCREFCARGARVIVTARSRPSLASARLHFEEAYVNHADFIHLDVTDEGSIAEALVHVRSTYGKLDVLVNNAGVLPDNKVAGKFEDNSLLDTPIASFRAAFEVNTLGPIRLCQAFGSLMKERRQGAIVNVSSQSGQLATMDAGLPAYRLSKLALNGVTRILADELNPFGVKVNSVSPGWVKTDMGGSCATVESADAAREIVELALSGSDSQTGKFLRAGREIPW